MLACPFRHFHIYIYIHSQKALLIVDINTRVKVSQLWQNVESHVFFSFSDSVNVVLSIAQNFL